MSQHRKSNGIHTNDPQLVVHAFQGEQLRRAREMVGLKRTELAERIGKSPSAVSQYESGLIHPDSQTLSRLAMALGVQVRFFARTATVPRLDITRCHFRALRSATQTKRRQALARGQMLVELFNELQHYLETPVQQLSVLREFSEKCTPAEMAALVREHWGLGELPIYDIMAELESRGVLVFPLPRDAEQEDYHHINAFSCWIGNWPVMFLDLDPDTCPPSTIHFDAAHELGHLLMHEDLAQEDVAGDPRLEAEANEFARCLLLPSNEFERYCPKRWRFDDWLPLKRHWRVSLLVMLQRANELGLITPSTYKNSMIDLSTRKIRGQGQGQKPEPDEWEFESPVVLKDCLDIIIEDELHGDICDKLGITDGLLEFLMEGRPLEELDPQLTSAPSEDWYKA